MSQKPRAAQELEVPGGRGGSDSKICKAQLDVPLSISFPNLDLFFNSVLRKGIKMDGGFIENKLSITNH